MKLTIVTPTYNRQNTLSKVYNSLVKQKLKDFVWMVIDDGSTDDTKSLIKSYIEEKKINIEYYYKKNGGKASALNFALGLIKTDYFCCLDSDDTLYDDATSIALELLEEEKNNDDCCGIVSLRVNENGQVLGDKIIPIKYKYIKIAKLYSILNNIELICFYKRNLINGLRFPEISGEKFVSPTWFQFKMTEKYKFRTTQSKMCICEYLNDGLTKNKRKIIMNNPKGYTLMKKESLKQTKRIDKVIKHAIMYNCGCILSKNKNWLKESPKKIICLICYPLSYFIYKNNFTK